MILLSNPILENIISIISIGVFLYVASLLYNILHKFFSKDSTHDKINLKNETSNKNYKVGYIENEVYKVVKRGNSYPLYNLKNERVGTLGASKLTRQNAFNEGKFIQAYINKNGKKIYRKIDKKLIDF